jgi:large subunit ribosomal protein L18
MSKNNKAFLVRQSRIRTNLQKKNNGLSRLTVFKSNSYIYAQIIDDAKSVTLAAANASQKEFSGLKKKYDIEAAKAVGKKLAEVALKNGIKKVLFDKGGYKYHGKIKALADSAREAGLVI